MKTFLKSTAGWAMLFCVLAAVSPAFPWSIQFGYESIADAVGALGTPVPKVIRIPLSAYADWHGAAISIAGGVGFLFLVATGSMRPAPWWRTLGIAVVGAAIITFTILYATHGWNHFPVREFGGLLAILSATGLLFVACLEVRQLLERLPNEKQSTPKAES